MARISVSGILCSISSQLTVILLMMLNAEAISAVRPEHVLLNVLTKPFVPLGSSSSECKRDSAIYLRELENYTPWALQMYDASAKISPGIITGNYQQLGNYDECLRIAGDFGIVGKACSATVQFNITKSDKPHHEPDMGDLLLNIASASNETKWTEGQTVKYEWLWCIPSSCTNNDLEETLDIALDPLKVKGRVDVVIQVSRNSCQTLKSAQRILDVADFAYISILVIFALILILSTTYDLTQRDKISILGARDYKYAMLTSFSLYTNGKNLLKTKRRGNSINCLEGIRFLSMCWIIYGHTFYNEIVGLNVDQTPLFVMHNNWSSMLVLNGNIVTDTFFLLSGTLLSYVVMSKKDKFSDKCLNLVNLYIHRYLRLTPPYAMMIGFYATLFYKFGTGPHWDTWVGTNRNYCRENWWTNLLYVNNYVNVPKMCISQSWYLAADMQLTWLSPILLYPMVKFRRSRYFWIMFSFSLVLSILSPLLVTYFEELQGTMIYYRDQTDVTNVFLKIYTRTYNRAGSYIIGLGLGYILSTIRTPNFKIPMVYVISGWTVVTVAGLSVIFGPINMYEYAYNRTASTFYAGFHRHVFALCVSWIIFTSTYGYAGPVGKFLSWSGWVPFSKLTYCAYLSHFLFLLADSGSTWTPHYSSPTKAVPIYFGNLVLTMILSAVWSLCFEMPFLVLERALTSLNKRERIQFPPKNDRDGFGSTQTKHDICRSMDTVTTSPNFSDILGNVKLSHDSVYNSQGTINYSISGSEELVFDVNERDQVPTHSKTHDEQGPSYIYVINASNYTDDVNAKSRTNQNSEQTD